MKRLFKTLAGKIRKKTVKKDSFPVPQGFTALTITNRCNHDCVFCYEGDRKGWIEPSLEQVNEILRKSREQSCFVVFCGAETLLRPDILDVVRSGKSAGLTLSAFTNGIPLSREGFVDELAEAGLSGLQVSFHFADQETFSLGTGTSPENFNKLLKGLENIREHNRKYPEKNLDVFTETGLFILNYGRLKEIFNLLSLHLSESFTGMRLGSIRPVRANPSWKGHMLEPLSGRREELISFLEFIEDSVDIYFSKIPLCMIKGFEHRALESAYKLGDTVIFNNNPDMGEIAEDRITVGRFHDMTKSLRENPYRWICRDCGLVLLCPHCRTSWQWEAFKPTRDQKPIPYPKGIIEEIADRIGKFPLIPPDIVQEQEKIISGMRFPETRFFSLPDSSSVKIVDVYIDSRPFLTVEAKHSDNKIAISAEPVKPGDQTGYIVGYTGFKPVEIDDQSTSVLVRYLKEISSMPEMPISMWKDFPDFQAKTFYTAARAWNIFHEILWPENNITGSWKTVRSFVENEHEISILTTNSREMQMKFSVQFPDYGNSDELTFLINTDPADLSASAFLASPENIDEKMKQEASSLISFFSTKLDALETTPDTCTLLKLLYGHRIVFKLGSWDWSDLSPPPEKSDLIRIDFCDRSGNGPDYIFFAGRNFISSPISGNDTLFEQCMSAINHAVRISRMRPSFPSFEQWKEIVSSSLKQNDIENNFIWSVRKVVSAVSQY